MTGDGDVPAGRFAGQVVVVAGAGSGIGAASAARPAREGAGVVVGDRDVRGLDGLHADAAHGQLRKLSTGAPRLSTCPPHAAHHDGTCPTVVPLSPEQAISPPGPIVRRKGLEMHGGLPFIGFSTIVYGVVGLAVAAGGAITKFRRNR